MPIDSFGAKVFCNSVRKNNCSVNFLLEGKPDWHEIKQMHCQMYIRIYDVGIFNKCSKNCTNKVLVFKICRKTIFVFQHKTINYLGLVSRSYPKDMS